MDDLRELYQEVILDHSKSPRNFRVPAGATHDAEGFNPLCGDRLHLHLVVGGDRVIEIGFEGSGCAISVAAASTMTEAVKGRPREEIAALADEVHAVVTGTGEVDVERLGKLAAFRGVAQFPMRVKCATLAWHTLKAALAGEARVTTE